MFAQCLSNGLFVSNKIIPMTQPRRAASALNEFPSELELRRETLNIHIDPREIHLEPVGSDPQLVAAPLGRSVVESSQTAQFWPMLAAALVGIGATIVGLAALSRFAQ
jgi:hypothetical protein